MRLLRGKSKAQALPIIALLLVSFIGLLGLAIDMGRLYIARTELSRAIDAAALAGVIELPDTAGAQAKASAYITDNQSDVVPSFPVVSEPYQIRVKGTRTVPMLFMGIFGFGSVNIDAFATAGYGIVPVDVVMAIDATGSMGASPCNSNDDNSGCPIWEAKNAAKDFVSVLLGGGTGSGLTLIGTTPFRGCYNPPRNNTKCIDGQAPGSMVTYLTASSSTLNTGINAIQAIGHPSQPSGGSGTNVCQALKKQEDILFGAGSHTEANTLRFLIILSDGDNVYNATEVNQSSPQSPESPCRPTSPSTSDGDISPNCRNDTQTQEGKVDTLSKNKADALKALGVEIYVVALSICGGIDSSVLPNPCSGVGNTGSGNPDSTADHRLLKCIASSAPGTNDHYFETGTAADLPDIFTQIATAIAFRLIE